MGFRTLKACVDALRREKQLVVIDHPVDPDLEIAEVQRRLFRGGGPAVLFSHPRGSGFPVLVNLYGTQRRVERIFADSLDRVKRLVELKIDPTAALKKPWRYWRSPYDALSMLPKRRRSGPVLAHEIPLLSVPPSSIPEVKQVCRSVSVAECRVIAEKALSMDGAQEVKAYLRDQLRRLLAQAVALCDTAV